MTKEELANKLNGREYGSELISKDEEKQAKEMVCEGQERKERGTAAEVSLRCKVPGKGQSIMPGIPGKEEAESAEANGGIESGVKQV